MSTFYENRLGLLSFSYFTKRLKILFIVAAGGTLRIHLCMNYLTTQKNIDS